jgi:hypothetical protein
VKEWTAHLVGLVRTVDKDGIVWWVKCDHVWVKQDDVDVCTSCGAVRG